MLAKPIMTTLLMQPNCFSLIGRPHCGHVTALLLTNLSQSGHVVSRPMSFPVEPRFGSLSTKYPAGIDSIFARVRRVTVSPRCVHQYRRGGMPVNLLQLLNFTSLATPATFFDAFFLRADRV